MELEKLGYTEKWLEYGLLDAAAFKAQLKEFSKEKDSTPEQIRFKTFISWLQSKKKITKKEIENYLEIALEDNDALMSGSAVRELFVSPILTEAQFELVMYRLPEFGSWTQKLITRELLKKRLEKEELTDALFDACMEYKEKFKDNRLLVQIIQQSEDVALLARFADNGSGKQIRTLARKKIDRVNRDLAKASENQSKPAGSKDPAGMKPNNSGD